MYIHMYIISKDGGQIPIFSPSDHHLQTEIWMKAIATSSLRVRLGNDD